MTIAAYILFFLALLLTSLLNYHRYMHMFQLNSYSAAHQLKWIAGNLKDVLPRHIAALLSIAALFVFGDIGLFVSAGLFLISIPFMLPKKAKKKLVFTPRVIRMCVTSVLLYGIACAASMLFLNGNMWQKVALPCINIPVLFLPMLANLINKPIESGINRHYINDAKRIINGLPKLTVVGITGSYGKTSTKFYLEKLLSARYNVLMTPESYNTTMGVVKTVRGSLNATYDIFLCEMGAKNVGEIKEICDIVHPKHSIITSIGPQHLESFKSIENIIKTKFEIADCITDGTVFLNYDNEYIRNNPCGKKTVAYGIGAGDGKSYFADEIKVSESGTTFTVHAPSDEKQEYVTSLLGAHNVENIVGAIATANTLGIPLSELVMPVRRLECVPHRLQINDLGNRIIIDDAFNSNPSGAKAALDVLKMFDGCRILVTPGMIELGAREYELNENFGKQAAQACDYAVLVGEKQAVPIKAGLLAAGFDEKKITVSVSLNEGLAAVNAIDGGGKKKIVLLENDLPDNF